LLKKVIVIVLVLIAIGATIGAIFIAYEYKKTGGDHQILLLYIEPNESSPGIGAVDMAFVIYMRNYDAINMTPIYPGRMYHPNATAPAEVQQQGGGQRLLLQDTLMTNNTETGAKLAQETVEYNTGIKTDAVVIMTPAAVEAMIDAVGPIYVEGIGYVNSSTVNFLGNEQNLRQTRGYSLYLVMRALMETYHSIKRPALLLAVANQYIQGNIIAIPKELFMQLGIASGINKLK
jgi:hypothetical protein